MADSSEPHPRIDMSLLPELLLTVLFGTQASFTHPGVILPQKELLGDSELKEIVKKTQKSREAREALGFSPRIWRALTETIQSGNDQLVLNKHTLISKVGDLALLGRNLLAAKEKAQDLAAEQGFEAEIRRLIDICIEKSGKPIAPAVEKTTNDHESHMKGAYKKVLVTSLQFLNNLMTNNETRKLHLWLHFFGTPSSANTIANAAKNSAKLKLKFGHQKPQPSSGSGIGTVGGTTGNTAQSPINAAVTVAKCNSLSAGFNPRYYKPGFLTEVPRLLQPDEIESLPMILQSGVMCIEGPDQAMQAVRCKLMLAQGYGRSLLREILVFLGAWEVDEDDLSYRMMTQVVEAILLNGLIPYAYECFRDEKDAITPAQSVLLKLLISVYRPSPLSPHIGSSRPPPSTTAIPYIHPFRTPSATTITTSQAASVASPTGELPEPSDNHRVIEDSIPNFFMNIFRKKVFPQTLKLIKLQGDIRSGKEKKEKFELNLWDLDRIYEGVYQFLDLLILFAEDVEARKALMARDKGLIVDLVQLLGELHKAVPRYVATKVTPPQQPLVRETGENTLGISVKVDKTYMVERPFDVTPGPAGDGELGEEEDEEEEEEEEEGDDDDDDDDGRDDGRALAEPEEFTWPHIKRYCVLLLSTFSWKNRAVQDLARETGGLQAVLNQCMIDDDNPYIREHSILCIRNMLDGNLENQKVVQELEAKQVVPSEVLDKHKWETYVDETGGVKLRHAKKRG